MRSIEVNLALAIGSRPFVLRCEFRSTDSGYKLWNADALDMSDGGRTAHELPGWMLEAIDDDIAERGAAWSALQTKIAERSAMSVRLHQNTAAVAGGR